MEILDLAFGSMIAGMVFFLVMYGISRLNRGSKGSKTAQESISSMYSTYNQQVKDVIAIKDSQLKRLQNKITQLEPNLEEDQSNTPIELGALENLAKERGINPALLKNPMLQKLIKKYTKGMGIEEIIAIADQFGLLKGNKQSKSDTPPIVQDNPQFF